jgi:hypothetical protein
LPFVSTDRSVTVAVLIGGFPFYFKFCKIDSFHLSFVELLRLQPLVRHSLC